MVAGKRILLRLPSVSVRDQSSKFTSGVAGVYKISIQSENSHLIRQSPLLKAQNSEWWT